MSCTPQALSALTPYLYAVRPGARPHISPEGLICSTDGKCRWVYQPRPEGGLLSRLRCMGKGGRCLLFTLDPQSVSVQRVTGRQDARAVFDTVSRWTGGQSNPSLRFEGEQRLQRRFLTGITLQPDRERICLDGGEGRLYLYAQPELLELIHALMTRTD